MQVKDEANTRDEFEAYYRDRAEKAIAGFRRKRLHAVYVPDRKAALTKILELIPAGASVGKGNSVTLRQIGILPALHEAGGHEIFDPAAREPNGDYIAKSSAESLKIMKKALLADVFLSGANAITLDGKVVCTDGIGNRAAAMIFGPDKVIIVAGVNKIVANLDEALKRIHEVVVPICHRWDVMKHNSGDMLLDTPCVRAGTCNDCGSVGRGCCYTIVIEGAQDPLRDIAKRGKDKAYPPEFWSRVNIILVGENLGI
ncbi:MAG: lactate utilization protein [Actinobacteria bacterium]|nr:lactate utilization protein [Actinomycetota bacterium]